MSLENGQINLIRRYLLEDLSEEERQQIEQLLMSKDDFYQELLYAEDNLIDDYIFGRLPEEDQPKFKKRFLKVPELRQSVSLATALRKHALETKPVVVVPASAPSQPAFFDSLRSFLTRPAVGFALSGMLLGVVGLDAWLLKKNSELRNRIGSLEARLSAPPISDPQQELRAARERNKQLQAELDRQQHLLTEESRRRQLAEEQLKGPTRPTEVGGTGVLAVTLVSGAVRESGTTKRIAVGPDIGRVQFKLDLAARDYHGYSVSLQTVEGKRKWSSNKVRLTADQVVFEVPAKILTLGDYRIVLSGVKSPGAREEIDNFYFRVVE